MIVCLFLSSCWSMQLDKSSPLSIGSLRQCWLSGGCSQAIARHYKVGRRQNIPWVFIPWLNSATTQRTFCQFSLSNTLGYPTFPDTFLHFFTALLRFVFIIEAFMLLFSSYQLSFLFSRTHYTTQTLLPWSWHPFSCVVRKSSCLLLSPWSFLVGWSSTHSRVDILDCTRW